MKTVMNIGDLKDEQEITITKKEIEDFTIEYSIYAMNQFIIQYEEMAEANWCPAMVEDLKRLFNAVLKGEEYAPKPEVE